MKNRLSHALPLPAGQRGAATLLVVVVLLIGMAVITITTSRTGVVEQKIAGNDVRAKGVQEAAEAGLEYATAWAGKHRVPWANAADRLVDCGTDAGCPNLPTNLAGQDLGNFSLSLQYERPLPNPDNYIKVTSTAIQPENNSSATSIAWIKPGGVLSNAGTLPPPVVMNGCMTGTTGTPDIFPKWTDLNSNGLRDANEWADANHNGAVDAGEWTDTNANGVVDNEMGPALLTSQNVMNGAAVCLDYCGSGGGAGCPVSNTAANNGGSQTHANIHEGTLVNNLVFPDRDGDGVGTIWEYYFSVSQAQFQANASTTLSTAGGRYWITDTGNWPGGTYGSMDDPVIIVFANGCPKPSGNTTIYGILFFNAVDGCQISPMNGWGSVKIYGSLGFNGNVNKMNANLEVHGVGDGSGMTNVTEIPIDASKLPGTWKDF